MEPVKVISAEDAMRRCLELAEHGRLWVSPNPMVGCVIVRKGKIVGEGFHKKFGGPHAEVFALHQAGSRARGATLYVNLEPCAHFGKTPPCSEEIIRAEVKEVVVASRDPNPLVRGRGIKRLRDAGISVRSGVLRREAERLNERFITFMKTGIPFVGAKLALTLDGRIADRRGRSQWITNAESRAIGHALRAEYDAIMVGADTAIMDDPQLTVRAVDGRQPRRILLAGSLNVGERLNLFRGRHASTIVVTSAAAWRRRQSFCRQLEARGVEVVVAGSSRVLRPEQILRALAHRGVASVLLEGGAKTIGSFLSANAVNRIHAFIAPTLLGEGKHGFNFDNPHGMSALRRLTNVQATICGGDVYVNGSLV